MSQFPIILIPPKIEQVKSEQLPLPKPPTPPQQPKPEPKKLNTTVIGVETTIAVIGVPIFSQMTSISAWLLFTAVMSALASHAWYQIVTYPQRRQEHRDEVADYSRKFKKYEQEKRQHDEEVRQAKSPEQVAKFQYNELLKVLQQTIPHDGSDSQARKNPEESKFRSYLSQYFPGKIYTGLTLKIGDFQCPYTPDFAYIDQRLNLYVDVELDEPYVYHTGQPIHYVGCGKDNNRNNFFITKGWLVIRFSEEQVIRWPDSCCKTVANVIAEITGNISILNQFASVSELQPIRQWTEAEALQMAQKQERDKYHSQSSFYSLMSITETKSLNPQTLQENDNKIKDKIVQERKYSRSNIRNKKKKICFKFKKYWDSQLIPINIEDSHKNFLDSLEIEPTSLGLWVKDNRSKAELFLKDPTLHNTKLQTHNTFSAKE